MFQRFCSAMFANSDADSASSLGSDIGQQAPRRDLHSFERAHRSFSSAKASRLRSRYDFNDQNPSHYDWEGLVLMPRLSHLDVDAGRVAGPAELKMRGVTNCARSTTDEVSR
jgi:hypothetical protein